MKRLEGIILKGIGGLYTVKTADSIYRCKARGIFRKDSLIPMVGDKVIILEESEEEGVIEEILPRKNSLIRPFIANIDKLFLIVSSCDPAPNTGVMDRILATADFKGIEPYIVITKTDICSCDDIKQVYTQAGFNVIDSNAEGSLEVIDNELKASVSVVAGNTGVGKSTLLNRLYPHLNLATGTTSKKLGRGRHTTRHVELYELPCGGFVADSPGFSAIETEKYGLLLKKDLIYGFREFWEFSRECKYDGCTHTAEEGCRILAALNEGKIALSRHQSYLEMYRNASKIKEWEIR